ncbi:MAG TPA: hypothetical protein VIP05_04630 [Burkholderiaceae bacterium]
MTSLLTALLATALAAAPGTAPDPALSALNWNVRFDAATGSTTLTCAASSSGSCTFWFGDGHVDSPRAAGVGTLTVGDAPAIVRVSATHAAYCVGVDADSPPKWPECTRGPLGGALDRSETVDYRRH